MKKSIAFLFVLLLAYSCSKDKSENLAGDFSLSGKFVTPNGTDAVSKATVKLYSGNTIITESFTDAEGKFTLSNIPAGEYDLKISKGMFTAARTVTLDDVNNTFDFNLEDIEITDLPNIAVVTGAFDNIETVLFNIGLVNPITQEPLFDIIDGQNLFGRSSESAHTHGDNTIQNRTFNEQLEPNVDFHFGNLIESPDLLASYDIIFLNCGLDEYKVDFSSNLTNYVANGGLLYTTDYAFVYLDDITNNGQDYLHFEEPNRAGDSIATEAEILNTDLLDWLTINFDITVTNNTVTIDQFLPSWQAVDTYNDQTVLPWLSGPIVYNGISDNRHLAYTFQHGDGAVLYSSFHTKNNPQQSEAVARSIQYLVFELSDLKQQ